MEKLELYLQSTGPKHDMKVRLYFGIAGLLYLIFGILVFYRYNVLYSYIMIVFGFLVVLYTLFYKKLVKRCYIILDELGIKTAIYSQEQQYFKGFFFVSPKRINILWKEVESIVIRPLKIQFQLKDGTQSEIALGGDLLYKQHQLLKSKLQEVVREQNIKQIERGE